MRRVVEPDQLLARRTQRLEVGGGYRRVDMSIMLSEKEKHGHVDSGRDTFQIQVEKFGRHRAERYVNATMDGPEFPRHHESGDQPTGDHAYSAQLLPIHRAILIRQLLHRHLLVKGFMWWRSDLSQPCQGDFILPPRRFGRHELVLRVLCLEQGHQWGHANERGHLFGVALSIKQPERGSPGMTDQDNLVLTQKVSQMIDDGVQVCEVP